jgi:hypothetical protein
MAQPTFATHATVQQDGQNNPFLNYLNTTGGSIFTVNSTGNISVAGGLTTAGIGSPIVLAYSANLAQAAAITTTSLLATGHAAGIYRVEAYSVVTTAFTSSTLACTIAYTDAKQAETPTIFTSATATALVATSGTYTFQSAGTAAITFSTVCAGIGPGVYDVWVTVTRLA